LVHFRPDSTFSASSHSPPSSSRAEVQVGLETGRLASGLKVAEHFDIRLTDMTSNRRPENIAFSMSYDSGTGGFIATPVEGVGDRND
jgi:hypothetical protein